jgi:nucleotide-binding universal stress UspA family protein
MDAVHSDISIKTILVGTDFSSCSDRALEYAINFSEKFGSEILLIHVIESFNYSVTDSMTVVGHEKALSVTAAALLDNQIKALKTHDISLRSHLSHGAPCREIINKAEGEGIDLIVLGTHGRSGMEHFLLGSVAERVVRTARCPVLTVRS